MGERLKKWLIVAGLILFPLVPFVVTLLVADYYSEYMYTDKTPNGYSAEFIQSAQKYEYIVMACGFGTILAWIVSWTVAVRLAFLKIK